MFNSALKILRRLKCDLTLSSGGLIAILILKTYSIFCHITFCVLAARPTVPVANRTQKQLEPPMKTSAGQQRVGRPQSGRKPNTTIPNNRTGHDRYTRWLCTRTNLRVSIFKFRFYLSINCTNWRTDSRKD